MIKVLVEVELVPRYYQSFCTFVEFCSVWDCLIVRAKANHPVARFSISSKHFKKIVGENAQIKSYSVPHGMERFITSFRVAKVTTR